MKIVHLVVIQCQKVRSAAMLMVMVFMDQFLLTIGI